MKAGIQYSEHIRRTKSLDSSFLNTQCECRVCIQPSECTRRMQTLHSSFWIHKANSGFAFIVLNTQGEFRLCIHRSEYTRRIQALHSSFWIHKANADFAFSMTVNTQDEGRVCIQYSQHIRRADFGVIVLNTGWLCLHSQDILCSEEEEKEEKDRKQQWISNSKMHALSKTRDALFLRRGRRRRKQQ